MQKKQSKTEAGYHHVHLKKKLISKAVDIISSQGRRGLTLRAVGQAANVSRSAPYRHFKNKEALLAAVAGQGFEELTRRLLAVSAREKDPLERLILQGQTYVSFAKENPAYFEVMYGFNLASYFLYPDLLDSAVSAAAYLFESIEACQEANILIKTDVIEMSFGAWMHMHGLAVLLINGLAPFDIQTEDDLGEIVRRYAMTYFEGTRQRG